MKKNSESVIDPFGEDQTEVVRSVDLAVVNPVVKEAPYEIPDELTGDLLEVPELAKYSPFFLILLSPYYPEPLVYKLGRYLKEVRRRMIELRDFERVEFYDTVYQRFVRFLHRCIEHAKSNLQT